MNKSDKIYVAGHTGLVGSAIVRKLKELNYTNIIVKNKQELDLRDQEAVNTFFQKEKPDYVFLSAALVGGIMANYTYPVNFIYDNIMIEFNCINAAFNNKVKRLLFLGSSCIYPKDSQQPIKEEYLLTGALEETNEAYALAKISGLKYCCYLNKQYQTNYLCVMPTNLYGLNDNYHLENSHVIPGMIRKFSEAKENNNSEVILWGTGKPLREFVFADDLAEILINLMNNYKDGDIINISSNEEITIKDLALLIKKIVGYQGNIIFDSNKPDGTYQKKLDLTKLKKLNIETTTSLEKGLIMTYENYKKGFKERL